MKKNIRKLSFSIILLALLLACFQCSTTKVFDEEVKSITLDFTKLPDCYRAVQRQCHRAENNIDKMKECLVRNKPLKASCEEEAQEIENKKIAEAEKEAKERAAKAKEAFDEEVKNFTLDFTKLPDCYQKVQRQCRRSEDSIDEMKECLVRDKELKVFCEREAQKIENKKIAKENALKKFKPIGRAFDIAKIKEVLPVIHKFTVNRLNSLLIKEKRLFQEAKDGLNSVLKKNGVYSTPFDCPFYYSSRDNKIRFTCLFGLEAEDADGHLSSLDVEDHFRFFWVTAEGWSPRRGYTKAEYDKYKTSMTLSEELQELANGTWFYANFEIGHEIRYANYSSHTGLLIKILSITPIEEEKEEEEEN